MKRTGYLLMLFVAALFVTACSETVSEAELRGSEAELQESAVPVFEIESVGAPGVPVVDAFLTHLSGTPFTATMRLNRPAPAGGLGVNVLNFFPFGPVAGFPAVGGNRYTIPEGEQELTIIIETVPASRFFLGNRIAFYLEDPDPEVGEIGRKFSDGFRINFTTNPDRPISTFEAEDARLRGTAVVDEDFGEDNASVEYIFGSRSTVIFDVDVEEAGNYELVLRYANSLTASLRDAREFPVTLNVNGERTSLVLDKAGSNGSSGSTLKAIDVTLEEGSNTVRLFSRLGGFALDKLELSPLNE